MILRYLIDKASIIKKMPLNIIKTNINNKIEFLSLSLILSYFFFHNILPVLSGIILSLYLMNLEVIKSLNKSLKKFLVKEKENFNLNKKDNLKLNKANKIEFNDKKDSTLTLVEAIEELGFIPSLNDKDESNLA